MEIVVYRSETVVLIRATGRFVLDECDCFREKVFPLIKDGLETAAVDLSETDFIDSAGLGVLVGLKIKANQLGFRLAVVDPSSPVQDILTVSKLSSIFDIVTGLDAINLRAQTAKPEFLASGGGMLPTSTADTAARVEEAARKASEAVQCNDLAAAARHFEEVVAIDSKNLAALTNIAVIYEKEPQWRHKALAQWEQVLTKSQEAGDTDRAQRARERIEALRAASA